VSKRDGENEFFNDVSLQKLLEPSVGFGPLSSQPTYEVGFLVDMDANSY